MRRPGWSTAPRRRRSACGPPDPALIHSIRRPCGGSARQVRMPSRSPRSRHLLFLRVRVAALRWLERTRGVARTNITQAVAASGYVAGHITSVACARDTARIRGVCVLTVLVYFSLIDFRLQRGCVAGVRRACCAAMKAQRGSALFTGYLPSSILSRSPPRLVLAAAGVRTCARVAHHK